MKDTQIGAAKVSVVIKWLVLVKMYGKSPKKLFTTTKINRLRNLNVLPLNEEGPNRFLNS